MNGVRATFVFVRDLCLMEYWVPNPLVRFRWQNPVVKYRRLAFETGVKPTVDVPEIAQ